MKQAVLILVLMSATAFLPLGMKAQMSTTQDSLVASLLTCSPGTEIYQYYGHSALRIRNVDNGADFIFNYGIFDFKQPNFIWRFVLGKTDYCMDAAPTEYFLNAYRHRGSAVRELVLNLKQEEIRHMADSLQHIIQQEGWTYHYSFFCDNCATRIRDLIAASVDGQIIYPQPAKPQTLRQIVHQYSEGYDWSIFGQDLLIGAPADTIASRPLQQFAPLIMEEDLQTALIKGNSGHARPLVLTENTLVSQGMLQKEKGFPLSPLACSIIMAVLALLLSIWDFIRKQVAWFFDAVLLLLQGMAGCLILFMVLFSQHPTVNVNWLLLVLNPLPLIFLYWIIRQERLHHKCPYHECARWWYLLFLGTSTYLPQYFGLEILILVLCLFIRSMSYHFLTTYRFSQR